MRFVGRAAFNLVFASAVVVLVSISLSQILLALALVTLLLSGEKLAFPSGLRWPFAAFATFTLAAVAFSGDPQGGTPQIRKLFVFGTLLVICSTFQNVREIRALKLAWAGVGSISGVLGITQYIQRRHEALAQHADYYGFFLDRRITGFAGHWMTFGGAEMIVFLMLASFLLMGAPWKYKLFAWPLAALLGIAITLGMTRSIFLLGVPVGLIYLLWSRSRVLVMALPVLAIVVAAVPGTLHERIVSVAKPHGDLDSNSHRAVCRIVGWQMIKAHPWLGLGPEQVGKQFDRYVPASVSRPLPNGWYGHLHNIYLQYAAERGIPGLLSILWLIGKATLDFLTVLRRGLVASEARFILYGSIAVVFAILAEGFFEYNLGDSEVLTMFLAVIACGYVAKRQSKEAPRVNKCVLGREI